VIPFPVCEDVHSLDRTSSDQHGGYKYICCWCGEWIPYGERTLEHVYPVSLGGTNDHSNLRIACRDCNGRRGNRYNPKQFMYN
jgi:5-methylcytosine-specific restriction endonuclease McrA